MLLTPSQILENEFGDIIPFRFTNKINEIENRIIKISKDNLIEELFKQGQKTSNDFNNIYFIGKNREKVLFNLSKITLNFDKESKSIRSNELELVLLEAPPIESVDTCSEKVKLNDSMCFKFLEITTSPKFKQYIDIILNSINKVLKESDIWYSNFLIKKILELSGELGEPLYKYLKSLFSVHYYNKNAHKLLLALIDKNENKGMYIPNTRIIENLIDFFILKKKNLIYNPVALISEMLASHLDFNQMHAKEAIESRTCIPAKLEESKYSIKAPLFQQAEIELFEGSRFYIFPIEEEGDKLLVITIPSEDKDDVEKLLRDNKSEFKQLFAKYKSKIRRLMQDIKKIASKNESFLLKIYEKTVEGVAKASLPS